MKTTLIIDSLSTCTDIRIYLVITRRRGPGRVRWHSGRLCTVGVGGFPQLVTVLIVGWNCSSGPCGSVISMVIACKI